MTTDDKRVARFCPYCERSFEGENSILSHLEQVAGQENHPEDITETHTAEDFPYVAVDADGNLLQVLDFAEDVDGVSTENIAAVSAAQVYHFIADLLVEDEAEMAHRVRSQLLGIGPGYHTPHQALYEALLAQLYTDDPDEPVQAALTPEGITIAARGESACCTAIEARDLCDGLEAARREAGLEDDMEPLIEFLRYAAEVLEEGEAEDFPVKFRDWRDS